MKFGGILQTGSSKYFIILIFSIIFSVVETIDYFGVRGSLLAENFYGGQLRNVDCFSFIK